MFVGDEGLCSKTVAILVHQMKLAGLDTTLFQKAQFLDLARVAPDAIAGYTDGHNLTRDQLYERFTGQNLPRNASDANTRTFMICATMAELLKSMGWTLTLRLVTAVGAEAVPGLLPKEEEASSVKRRRLDLLHAIRRRALAGPHEERRRVGLRHGDATSLHIGASTGAILVGWPGRRPEGRLSISPRNTRSSG